jgi:hypothetical protein
MAIVTMVGGAGRVEGPGVGGREASTRDMGAGSVEGPGVGGREASTGDMDFSTGGFCLRCRFGERGESPYLNQVWKYLLLPVDTFLSTGCSFRGR